MTGTFLAKQPSKSHSMRVLNPLALLGIKKYILLSAYKLIYLYIQACQYLDRDESVKPLVPNPVCGVAGLMYAAEILPSPPNPNSGGAGEGLTMCGFNARNQSKSSAYLALGLFLD